MGKTFSTGLLTNGLWQDASNNIGIGGSPSGSYKLEVTGTAKVSSTLLVSGALSGTTADFETTIGTRYLQIRDAGTSTPSIRSVNNTIAQLRHIAIEANTISLRTGATSGLTTTEALGISATGAATFAGSVTINQSGYTFGAGLNLLNWQFVQGGDNALYLAYSGTQKFTITSAGNVGIGVTPAAWASPTVGKVIQIGNRASIFSYNNQTSDIGNNIYFNGADYIYNDTAASTLYRQGTGLHQWFTAPSGTSGTSVALEERMRITSGGDVFVGFSGSAAGQRLRVQGADSGSVNYSLVVANSTTASTFLVRNDGAVQVVGSLSKGSGSFRIDHPLESMTETHQLVHSFIEGPRVDLIYRGKLTLVNGKAEANIDEVSTMTEGTFEALCREVQCFTTNESGWDLVKGKVIGNIIYIESQNTNSTDEISWMVIGERKDKHIIDTDWTDENGKVIVEPLKTNLPTIQNLQEQNQDLKSRLDKAGL